MTTLQDIFDAAAKDARAVYEAKKTTRTQKQALGEAIVELQRATLAVGDVILDDSETLAESFTNADLAYAGGYLGAISALVTRLSGFVRNYPAE